MSSSWLRITISTSLASLERKHNKTSSMRRFSARYTKDRTTMFSDDGRQRPGTVTRPDADELPAQGPRTASDTPRVIRAAFADAAQGRRELVGDADTFSCALDRLFEPLRSADPAYARMLAWMLLSGYKPEDLQDEFPTVRRLVQLVGVEERCNVLLAVLVIYGWQVFADHLLPALGCRVDERGEVLEEIISLVHHLSTNTVSKGGRPQSRPR